MGLDVCYVQVGHLIDHHLMYVEVIGLVYYGDLGSGLAEQRDVCDGTFCSGEAGAGTEEEPANWASECIRPIVSVIP